MLTKQLAIADYDRGRVLPDRLSRKGHAQYTAYAERMLQVYQRGIGRTRRDLHLAVHAVLAEAVDCPSGALLPSANCWTKSARLPKEVMARPRPCADRYSGKPRPGILW
ncbi:MAG TPA: hypothetical protein VG099_26785 [Gemmataceae bacterium]|jgi:hypothetical protein|nr:hypothetical protein [Gemmataceae bacterium]